VLQKQWPITVYSRVSIFMINTGADKTITNITYFLYKMPTWFDELTKYH